MHSKKPQCYQLQISSDVCPSLKISTNTSRKLCSHATLPCPLSCQGKEASSPDTSCAPGVDDTCKEHIVQGCEVVILDWRPAFSALTASGTLAACGTNLGHGEADEQLPREAPLKKRTEIQLGPAGSLNILSFWSLLSPSLPGCSSQVPSPKSRVHSGKYSLLCLWGCSAGLLQK